MSEGGELPLEKKKISQTFDEIGGTYDSLNRFLSAGIDQRWRQRAIDSLKGMNPRRGLDVATGTADVAVLAAQTLPGIEKIVGVDLANKMMDRGRQKAAQKAPGKIELMQGDGENLPFGPELFDFVTMAFGLRNMNDPQRCLREIYRVLRPGGRSAILEFSLPQGRALRALYLFYFRRILPLVGQLVSGHGQAYRYLNQSVENFPPPEHWLTVARSLGMKAQAESLTCGICTLYLFDKPLAHVDHTPS